MAQEVYGQQGFERFRAHSDLNARAHALAPTPSVWVPASSLPGALHYAHPLKLPPVYARFEFGMSLVASGLRLVLLANEF